MASTNSTTHYELSQYIGTDKPTYLVDYNQDMGKIDAGIYAAKSEADTNSSAIGTLSNLTTTAKSNLVTAINEVDSETAGIGTLSSLTTTAKTDLVSAINEVDLDVAGIGTLANLTTTDKTNLVSAVNEVDGDIGDLSTLTTTAKSSLVAAVNEVDSDVGDLSTLTTTAKSSSVAAINEVKTIIENFNLTSITPIASNTITVTGGTKNSPFSLTVAKNSDGSLAKIYGTMVVSSVTGTVTITIPNSGLAPSSEITINNAGIVRKQTSTVQNISPLDITIATNGTITMSATRGSNETGMTFILFPMLYFIKDFGDVPQPTE